MFIINKSLKLYKINKIILPKCISNYSFNFSSNAKNANEATTHFGFQTVPKEKKQELVASVFHGVADRFYFCFF